MAALGERLMAQDPRQGLLLTQSYFPAGGEADFLSYVSGAGQPYTSLATGTGAAVALTAGGVNGIVNILSGTGAAGNDSGVISSLAAWKFLAQTALYGETLLQYTEASTNKANVFFGFSSVAAAALMTDGAMSTASQSTVGIYKKDGSLNWHCFTSNGTTTSDNTCDQTANGANYQRLRVECRDLDGVNMECTFFLNGLPLTDSSTHRPVVQYVAQASAAAMKFVAGYVASGSTAAAESLNVDYACAEMRRSVAGQF